MAELDSAAVRGHLAEIGHLKDSCVVTWGQRPLVDDDDAAVIAIEQRDGAPTHTADNKLLLRGLDRPLWDEHLPNGIAAQQLIDRINRRQPTMIERAMVPRPAAVTCLARSCTLVRSDALAPMTDGMRAEGTYVALGRVAC